MLFPAVLIDFPNSNVLSDRGMVHDFTLPGMQFSVSVVISTASFPDAIVRSAVSSLNVINQVLDE